MVDAVEVFGLLDGCNVVGSSTTQTRPVASRAGAVEQGSTSVMLLHTEHSRRLAFTSRTGRPAPRHLRRWLAECKTPALRALRANARQLLQLVNQARHRLGNLDIEKIEYWELSDWVIENR